MDDLHLSDTLKRYFSDVFLLCADEQYSDKASLRKTVDLIRSGNIPELIITEIADICWNTSALYLSKREFFSALKLVAAYQASLALKSELLSTEVDLPLPRFTWSKVENGSPTSDLIELSNDLNDYREHVDTASTDSEFDSDTLGVGRCESPDVSSIASDSPTPTNSVQDRNWAIVGAWQGLISEEQRQLLGTEEESSDKHSSEEDTEVCPEVWAITPEQREYYTNQFRLLQPDVNALLPGPIARTFFEKSRLSVQILRKIWQMADVTKDGALSLQEFMTAMHLVVLKRNHVELPDTLPPSLIPNSEVPETEPILSTQTTKETAKVWTKFGDSPTTSISSPGPKPVNFDFQKVALDMDPKIFHPVALRLTPEYSSNLGEECREAVDGPSPKLLVDTSVTQNSAIQRPQPKKNNLLGRGAIPPPPCSQNSIEEGPISLPNFPPPKKDKPPPPPPRPFKTHGRSSSLDLNKLNKHIGPPTVPPRVSPSTHSSRKLTNQRSEGDYAGCRIESETPFANFDQFEKYENVSDDIFPGDVYEAERKKLFAQFMAKEPAEEAPQKHGAFEVYRKPCKNSGSPLSIEDKIKWELFQKLQDENTVLLRICQELSQELADIKEEKHSLKVKLEKLTNGS